MSGKRAKREGYGGEVLAYVRQSAMSRIGKLPITVPSGVNVDLAEGSVKVKGPKGEFSRRALPTSSSSSSRTA